MIVVVTGPIASGKSTVARALAEELQLSNVRTAVIDLDLVHDRLAARNHGSDDSTWARARQVAATMACAYLADGVAVVIADGSYNRPGDRATFIEHLHPGSDPVFVTLRVSFDEALRRAQGDSTRGRSQDPRFLGAHYAQRDHLWASVPPTDIVMDTEQTTAQVAATTIARLIMARTAPASGSPRESRG